MAHNDKTTPDKSKIDSDLAKVLRVKTDASMPVVTKRNGTTLMAMP
jgi:hypothetical protein